MTFSWPQPASTLSAADLLSRVSHGDPFEMGALLTRANPPVTPQNPSAETGPDLPGTVTSYRWPSVGPPADILGPPTDRPSLDTAAEPAVVTCQHCGRPLDANGPRRGRPAKYCSGACRTAAQREHRRHPVPASRRPADTAAARPTRNGRNGTDCCAPARPSPPRRPRRCTTLCAPRTRPELWRSAGRQRNCSATYSLWH